MLERISDIGVVGALRCSYPRFRGSLQLSALGFAEDSDTRKCLNTVSQKLLVDAMADIQKAERLARAVFTESTYSVSTGINVRFCPSGKLPDLVKKLEDTKNGFTEATTTFRDNFQEHLKNARILWREVLMKQTNISDESREEIMDDILKQLSVPTPLSNQFVLEASWFEFRGLSRPAFSELSADDAAASAEAWEKIKQDAERQTKDMTRSFVHDCKKELYDRLRSFFTGIRGNMQEGKPINTRTVKRIHEFLKSVESLNFMKDRRVDTMINEFRANCLTSGSGEILDGTIKDDQQISAVMSEASRIMLELSVASLDNAPEDGGAIRQLDGLF